MLKNVLFLILCESKTILLILIFYLFSISLTFYNKKFITIYPYPLSITMLHLIVKFLLASFVRGILRIFSKHDRTELCWKDYFRKISPSGITSSLDIGLSNWSFEFITVSLYTMTKSTSIIFILIFAIVFKLEKKGLSIVFIVLFIAGGLFMFTYKSTQFNMDGFMLCLLASFISGIRWTTAQLVTQKSEIGLQNPIDMIYHIQPWMILTLLPLSAWFEGIEIISTKDFFRFSDINDLIINFSTLMSGAMIAFCLECSEYLVITHTSSLTLSIAGIIKEVCVLYLATKINGDQLNNINIIGLSICMLGILLHVAMKIKHNKSVNNVFYNVQRKVRTLSKSMNGLSLSLSDNFSSNHQHSHSASFDSSHSKVC
uniref:Slc35c-3 n=1 Tax=Schmidtea mediterranea TaxID=79327 RepID=A0A0H3YFJ8_SCHMD|nr:slc35c-3 [Schmidtea mediterranea]